MKPQINDDEILLDINLDPEHYWETKKIIFGKKAVIINGNHHESKIKFSKDKTYKGDSLDIRFSETVPQYEICDKGHRHETGQKEYHSIRANLPWEYVEQFVSWINDGDPSAIYRASRPDLYDIEKLKEENSRLKKALKALGVSK